LPTRLFNLLHKHLPGVLQLSPLLGMEVIVLQGDDNPLLMPGMNLIRAML
jgi:hypothetical protein